VSGGGAVAALTEMLFSLPWWGVQASAGAGALLSMALVAALARQHLWRGEPGEANARLLLGGVVMASGWVGLITLILTVAPENNIAVNAATAPPPDTPSTYGSANGLRSSICMSDSIWGNSPPPRRPASGRCCGISRRQ
jgi:hypothetical protein